MLLMEDKESAAYNEMKDKYYGLKVILRNCTEITCATCAGYFFESTGQKT